MKKLLTAMVVLLPIVYAFGRVARRPIVVRSPDVYVNTVGQGKAECTPSTALAQYERLERHKVIVDPYVAAFLSLIAAAAAGVFAWQSNQLNDSQTKLLERQVALEASQALPNFRFRIEYDRNPDQSINTEWVVITNEGGLARNLIIGEASRLQVQCCLDNTEWVDLRDRYEDPSIPVLSYALVLGPRNDSGDYGWLQFDSGQATARLGYEGNAAQYRDLLMEANQQIRNRTGSDSIGVILVKYIAIAYQDYQGNERDEFYVYGVTLPSGEPAQTGLGSERRAGAVALRDEEARLVFAQRSQDIEDGYYVDLRSGTDDAQVNLSLDRLLDQSVGIPVATPLALGEGDHSFGEPHARLTRSWRERHHERHGVIGRSSAPVEFLLKSIEDGDLRHDKAELPELDYGQLHGTGEPRRGVTESRSPPSRGRSSWCRGSGYRGEAATDRACPPCCKQTQGTGGVPRQSRGC